MWRKPTWLSTMDHGTCYRLAQQKAMKAPFICLLHRTESYVTLRYVTFRECLVLVFVFLMTPFCERVGFFCSWKYIIESEVWKSAVLTDKNLASIYFFIYVNIHHSSDNMSFVHYKFKSNNEFKTLTFDGVNISVADLRKEIVQKSKMVKLMDDFHLQITNPQTGEGSMQWSRTFCIM